MAETIPEPGLETANDKGLDLSAESGALAVDQSVVTEPAHWDPDEYGDWFEQYGGSFGD